MKRWTLCAALLAVPTLVSAQPLPGDAEAGAFFGWIASALERGDWRLSALGPGAAIFTRDVESAPAGAPRLWVRLELQEPVVPSGTLSMRQLVEFDCDERQIRTLEGASYKMNNLSGAGTAQSDFGGWSRVDPDQALNDIVTLACGAPAGKAPADLNHF